MMRPKALALAALAVLVLTNVVALGGVLWNRSGEPESELTLSQRELRLPYRGFDRESSGLALSLNWRVVPRQERNTGYWDYSGGGSPEWLDKAKLESLGFDMKPEGGGGIRWNDRTLSRDVLLVLELDGEAWRQVLSRTREYRAAEEAKLAAMAEGKEKDIRLKSLADQLAREENENSRLFVVDAGLDAKVLRGRYPDRTRYAIVRGQVRPPWEGGRNEANARGYVNAVSIATINVPYEFRELLAGKTGKERFSATVPFGQRMEPWISRLELALH